jgi:hypothetical protein
VTLYQVFRRPVPADIVAQNLANIPIPVRYSFIYDGVELRDYFVRHSDPRLLPLFDSLKFVAWKVDLWRYCRLYEEGGLYLDARAGAEIVGPARHRRDVVSAQADALLLRSLSTEAFEHDCIFVYDPVGRNVGNCVEVNRRWRGVDATSSLRAESCTATPSSTSRRHRASRVHGTGLERAHLRKEARQPDAQGGHRVHD